MVDPIDTFDAIRRTGRAGSLAAQQNRALDEGGLLLNDGHAPEPEQRDTPPHVIQRQQEYLASRGLADGQQGGQQQAQEEPSVLDSIISGGLSGIGMVSNLVDLPASMVRDVLGAKNPFDQLLTPFSFENRLSGRDLGARWGLMSENKETGWVPLEDPVEFAQDALGFAVELATDPLALASGWLKAGRAAEAIKRGTMIKRGGGVRRYAEKFGDTVDKFDPGHQLGKAAYQSEAVRGAVQDAMGGIGGGIRRVSDAAAATRAGGYVADAWSKASPWRQRRRNEWNQAFDSRVRNFTTEQGQAIGRVISDTEQQLDVEWRTVVVPVLSEIMDSNLRNGMDPFMLVDGMDRNLRRALEDPGPLISKERLEVFPLELHKPLQQMKDYHRTLLKRAEELHIKISELEDTTVDYLHRQMMDQVQQWQRDMDPRFAGRTSGKTMGVASKEHQGHRAELVREADTDDINDLTADAGAHAMLERGDSVEEVGKYLEEKFPDQFQTDMPVVDDDGNYVFRRRQLIEEGNKVEWGNNRSGVVEELKMVDGVPHVKIEDVDELVAYSDLKGADGTEVKFSRQDVKKLNKVPENTEVAPGVRVQWTSGGVDQFAEPKVVESIESLPGGEQYVRFVDEKSGAPLKEVRPVDPPRETYQREWQYDDPDVDIPGKVVGDTDLPPSLVQRAREQAGVPDGAEALSDEEALAFIQRVAHSISTGGKKGQIERFQDNGVNLDVRRRVEKVKRADGTTWDNEIVDYDISPDQDYDKIRQSVNRITNDWAEQNLTMIRNDSKPSWVKDALRIISTDGEDAVPSDILEAIRTQRPEYLEDAELSKWRVNEVGRRQLEVNRKAFRDNFEMTPEQLRSMKVADLKDILRDAGMKTGGNKTTLLERLEGIKDVEGDPGASFTRGFTAEQAAEMGRTYSTEVFDRQYTNRYVAFAEHMRNHPEYEAFGGIFTNTLHAIQSGFRSATTAMSNASGVTHAMRNGFNTGLLRMPGQVREIGRIKTIRGPRMTVGKFFGDPSMKPMIKSGVYDEMIEASPELKKAMVADKGEKFFALNDSGQYTNRAAINHWIDNVEMDEKIASDLLASFDFQQANPFKEGVSGTVANVFRSFTALFKAGVLTAPARYTRDVSSGQIRLWQHGVWSYKSAKSGMKTLFNQPDKTLLEITELTDYMTHRGLEHTPENATKAMREIYTARHGHSSSIYRDIDNVDTSIEAAQDFESMARAFPGGTTGPGNMFKEAGATLVGRRGGSLDPRDIAGFNNRRTTEFVGVKAGDIIGKHADDMNRLPGLIELMRRGVSSDEAMKIIDRIELNYDPRTFTPTEQWLKKIFPFYSFFSRELAYLSRELMTNPTGRLGKLIRLQAKATPGEDEEQYVPEYVRSQMAIPLGDSKDGGQNYLTNFGLMHEDPIATLGTGLSDPQEGMRNILSKMNPLIKGFAEYGLGRSSFQGGPLGGRDISDMDPNMGRILTQLGLREETPSKKAEPFISRGAEFAVSNSPISRIISSTKTLLDDRKSMPARALNLTTGMSITTVSPDQSRRALRDIGNAIARDAGARPFETFHISKDLIEYVQSRDPELAQALEGIKQQRSRWGKERRAEIRREKKEAEAAPTAAP